MLRTVVTEARTGGPSTSDIGGAVDNGGGSAGVAPYDARAQPTVHAQSATIRSFAMRPAILADVRRAIRTDPDKRS